MGGRDAHGRHASGTSALPTRWQPAKHVAPRRARARRRARRRRPTGGGKREGAGDGMPPLLIRRSCHSTGDAALTGNDGQSTAHVDTSGGFEGASFPAARGYNQQRHAQPPQRADTINSARTHTHTIARVLAHLGGHRRATKRASIDVQQCPVSISQSPSRRSPSKHATSTQQAHAKHERTIEQTYYVKQAPSGAMSGVLARICVSISDTRVLVRPSVSFFYLNPSKCGGY